MKTKLLSLALASLMVLSLFSGIFVSAEDAVDYDALAASKGYVCRIGTKEEAAVGFDADATTAQNGGYFKYLSSGDKGITGTVSAEKSITSEDQVITLIANVTLKDSTQTIHSENKGAPINFTASCTIDGQNQYKITRDERIFNLYGYKITFKNITLESTGDVVEKQDGTCDEAASTGSNNGVIQTYGGQKDTKGFGYYVFDNVTVLDNSASKFCAIIVGTNDTLHLINGTKVINVEPTLTKYQAASSVIRLNAAGAAVIAEDSFIYSFDPDHPDTTMHYRAGILANNVNNTITVKNSVIKTGGSAVWTNQPIENKVTIVNSTIETAMEEYYPFKINASVNPIKLLDNVTFKGGPGVTSGSQHFLGAAFSDYKAAYNTDTLGDDQHQLVYPDFYDKAQKDAGKVCRIGEPAFAYNMNYTFHDAVTAVLYTYEEYIAIPGNESVTTEAFAALDEAAKTKTPAADAYYEYDRTALNAYYYSSLIDAIKAQQPLVTAAQTLVEQKTAAYETAKAAAELEGADDAAIAAAATALEEKTAAEAALAKIDVPIYMINDINLNGVQFGNSGVTTNGSYTIDGQGKYTITSTKRLTNVLKGTQTYQNLKIVMNDVESGGRNGTFQINGDANTPSTLNLYNVEITDNSNITTGTIIIAADSGTGVLNVKDCKIKTTAGTDINTSEVVVNGAVFYVRGADVTLNVENTEVEADAASYRLIIKTQNNATNLKNISIKNCKFSNANRPAINAGMMYTATVNDGANIVIEDTEITSVNPGAGAILLANSKATITNSKITSTAAAAIDVKDKGEAEIANTQIIVNKVAEEAASPAIKVAATGKLVVYTADITEAYATDAIATADGGASKIIGVTVNGAAQGLAAAAPTMSAATLRSKEDGFGLRFTGVISAANMASINALKDEGYITAVSYGTLIAMDDDVTAVGTFTKAALQAANKQVKDVPAADGYKLNADGSVALNVAITLIDTGNYGRNFTARSYIVITLKNESVITLYATEAAKDSIKNVTRKVLADVKAAPEGLYVGAITGYYALDGEAYVLNTLTGYTYFTSKQVTSLKRFAKD